MQVNGVIPVDKQWTVGMCTDESEAILVFLESVSTVYA
jgi:hypothetical protein